MRSVPGPGVIALLLALVPCFVLAACGGEDEATVQAIVVDYPLSGSVFPPEIVAPTFLWHDDSSADRWRLTVAFADDAPPLELEVAGEPPPKGRIDQDCLGPTNEVYEGTPYQQSAHSWTPEPDTWETLKKQSVERMAVVTFEGFQASAPAAVLSRGSASLMTSRDPVGAPVFYRDVPLMPAPDEPGVIKPLNQGAVPLIAWRLRDISRPESRVVLTGMPSCANCHSFSRDGKTLGMDVDGPQGDKGAYALVPLEPRTNITADRVISWNSFAGKPKGHKTIGFLSQVSPDGRHAITTLNESLYVSNFSDYKVLQVFYPTRGILAWYSRDTGEMKALPGADDTKYVHCSGTWSPDGKYLVFSRAVAKDPYVPGVPRATYANDPNETKIQYDLCRIPFNNGRGGEVELIQGASANGMSNTFPKVSPDGKWIVWTACRNGQLMRPDGRLWIVSAEGGEPREMNCNLSMMNSWHTFSPNGRWMAFSSKANTPYTQMFLTHIDEEGNDSPAILVPNSTAANRAVNIPEFLNAPYDALQKIQVPAVSHFHDTQKGLELMDAGDFDGAMKLLRRALQSEPDFTRAHLNLGRLLSLRGDLDAAIKHYEQALEVNNSDVTAHVNLGQAWEMKGEPERAKECYREALDLEPHHPLPNNAMGQALLATGADKEAETFFRRAVTSDASFVEARKNLALTLLRQRKREEALAEYRKALELAPDDSEIHSTLSLILLSMGDAPSAVQHLQRVVEIDKQDVRALAALAWLRATSPREDTRDGEEAVTLAERALSLNGSHTPDLLDVLAAAQAEAGHFEDACKSAQAALGLFTAEQAQKAAQVQARLELYRKGKPFRTPPPRGRD